MPDPIPTPTPEPAKPTRTRGPLNQRWLDELSESAELTATTAKPEFATLMAEEGIDADFLTAMNTTLTDAAKRVADAISGTASKGTVTDDEEVLKLALLKAIRPIHNRAKRKYPKPGDPGLGKYFVNQLADAKRSLLESASAAILETLKTETLPHLKPAEVTALQAARTAYVGIQTDQTGAQGDATGARSELEAKVKDVTALRRQLQLAADLLWPADEPTNAGTRGEFKLPPDKALA